jgi:Dyp-type peroxidase family
MLMPVDLDKPLSWKDVDADEAAMLDDLQGNILKSHGRDHTAQLFLQFPDSRRGRAFLSALADQVKSAAQQLHEAKIYRETHVSAGGFIVCFLSYDGYRALGVEERKIPADPAFRAGMKQRGVALADPPISTWDHHFQQGSHTLLLIADDSAEQVGRHLADLRGIAQEYGVCEIGAEMGKAIPNKYGKNIEHFGYVDGISVPIMVTEDLPDKRERWTPEAPLGLALVRDPGGQDAFSFGSFFVFRKLEQNVRAFKQAEEQLAHVLGLEEPDEERAGAMIVGRFEDGTPLVLSQQDGLSPDKPVNDFTYAQDSLGLRCPVHAHIRKVNPRGESNERDERSHLMVRRGITYGERQDDPNDEHAPLDQRPTGGVGLLFMAYQSDIGNQFEHMQRHWANNPNYVVPGAGLDPIIGQVSADYRWPVFWGQTSAPITAPLTVGGFVTLKGGEYFFAPSISFLKSLDSEEQKR